MSIDVVRVSRAVSEFLPFQLSYPTGRQYLESDSHDLLNTTLLFTLQHYTVQLRYSLRCDTFRIGALSTLLPTTRARKERALILTLELLVKHITKNPHLR